jgi:ABC-type branched-subunit amino acid transport system ATPase component
MGIARSFQIPRVFGKMSVLDNIRLAITSKEKKVKKSYHFSKVIKILKRELSKF